jgi:glyoxylase-like metal-dependent hydrolase (beta-lactamase superfamily II)
MLVGDTLFRGSVGRTDLPGGDWAALVASIRTKLFTLPDEVLCYPGHEGETTLGRERRANPFVGDVAVGIAR